MKNNVYLTIDNFLKKEKATIIVKFDKEKNLLNAKFKSLEREVNAYENNYEDVISSLSSALLSNRNIVNEKKHFNKTFSDNLDERLYDELEIRFVNAFGSIYLMTAETGKGNRFVNEISDFKSAVKASYNL